ncbi:DUF2280 domain-containing protein [Acinetobacter sp. ANC 4177]|uniref:DUF2280 domain-containing protein n=1 Tax=Acinetobacter sp. ANC 4177 TaxID=2529838 RepID=UPI00103A9369|nr:DUF2280 domain-containing protein [Acinetobacter sp. ANC 4177]TCB76774.1 DUF2280 domain-containing protein [Acinetobacter sp. ANC 4177]
MAALKEPVKMFIVQSLACFDTPQQVADAVMQRYGIEIDRRQCENYDPTKFAGRNTFVRKARSNFMQESMGKAYKVNMPRRPFLGLTESDELEVMDLIVEHLTNDG